MKPSTKRALVVLGICAACTLLFAILWAKEFRPLRELEFWAEDWQMRLGRKTQRDDRIILIGVDKPVYGPTDFNAAEIKEEPTLSLMQQNFPWSRAVWARLIQKLGDSGAKVIVFDFVFAAPGPGDDELKQALDKYGDRVVLGYNVGETHTEQRGFRELQLPADDILTLRKTNSPVEDPRLGFVNVWPDEDGILRRSYYQQRGDQFGDLLAPDVILESLDARVLRAYGRTDLIPSGFDGRRFRYTGEPGAFISLRIGDVLTPSMWKANFHEGADFKDKIVLVGPTADIFQDYHDSPFSNPKAMLGPEVHLNIINAALHGEFLQEPSFPAKLFVIVLAGICALTLCFLVRQPLWRFGAVILVTVVYWWMSYFVFNHGAFSVWLIAIPSVTLASASLITLTYDYFLERLEKRRVRRTLERYVSKDVVKEVLDNPETYLNSLGGTRKHMTVLFSDVRNFTTLTESSNEAQLVKQLNEYFKEMVAIVFANQGRLDKFIGDAVMADWGSNWGRRANPNPAVEAKQAVAAALAMKKALPRLNQDWKTRGMPELAFGIGINHGEVIQGNLGSDEKMEVSVIGDAVNLASRLESLTKEYHLDFLLGEKMAPLVSDAYLLRTVDYVQVKGKTRPVDVFTVADDGATKSIPAWLTRYESGVKLYRKRKFAEAASEFEESLRQRPNDHLSEMYLKRCKSYLENPPGESWDGVYVMTKK